VARAWLLPAIAWLAGCAALPESADLRDATIAYPDGTPLAARDGRARFREIFCALTAPDGHDPGGELACDDLLWRLPDEPAIPPASATLPALAPRLRIFVISGAFGDCRIEDMVPYGDAIERLVATGVPIQAVTVSGRSSAAHNARQIADAVRAARLDVDERIVLLGYSKGAVDILQFLVDEPELARRVAAAISVAGPIFGSPLAGTADWWYRKMFTRSFAAFCDPGDGGVIESLVPEARARWMADHPLPRHVRYLSIAAFTTREHLSRGLRPSWRMLASTDKRNDGQVVAGDAVIPGSTLLGYANADHWDVAIALDKQLPYLSARRSARRFPRTELLQAMLLYVSEDLDAAARAAP